jgi:hypothetical protein
MQNNLDFKSLCILKKNLRDDFLKERDVIKFNIERGKINEIHLVQEEN